MIKILAIDGGGIRGLLAAELLAYIEAVGGKPVAQMFDYIVGTSTGGMLALALSRRNALAASAMVAVYREYGPQIFRRGFRQTLMSLGNLNGPKYDAAALERCARACLSTDSLGDAATNVMVTSCDLKARAPQFFSSYATPKISMVDAAMSTSAAPTYFAPRGNYIDGGICDNNPALSGVIEACKVENATVRDCLVLSVGTGSVATPIDGKEAGSWGLLTWAQRLPDLFMDYTSGLHEYHLNRLLPDANVLRLQCQVSGSTAEMDNTSADNFYDLRSAAAGIIMRRETDIDAFIKRLL